jgi:hypothetical protein
MGNPMVIAGGSVRTALKAELLMFPLALGGWVLISPLFALAPLVPLVLLFVPELRLKDAAAQRREGAERELPFFSAFVSVLGSAGVSLYDALMGLAKSEVFPCMGREALLARRDVEIFGMNPHESLEGLAAHHPSRRFADFLAGYTSKARSGGDVASYLSSEGGTFLRGLEGEWGRYADRVGVVGSIMITVFGVVPLLLMVVGVFSPSFSFLGLVIFTAVGVPLMTLALLYLAGRMLPMREDPCEGKPARSLVVALPALALGVVFGQAWIGAASFLLVFFSAYGISVKGQLTENRELDRGVALFLKDLLEYKRQDYDLSRAVVAIQASNRYNRRFDGLLAKLAAKLKSGVPLDEVKVDCRNRLAKLTFLLLGEMSRSGGGTVDTVYQVSSFAGRVTEMRQNAASEMKPYLILAYISPVLLAFGITFVGGVLSSFGGRVGAGLQTLHASAFAIGPLPPNLSQVSDLLIVASAAALGVIGAKLSDFTARNTMRAAVNVALAAGAILIMSALGSHSLFSGL